MMTGRMLFVLILAAQPTAAHELYKGLVSPFTGQGCCNDRDCRPIREDETRFNQETGTFQIKVGGQWWTADDPRWYIGPSPDGSWHGCMMPGDTFPRCTIGGIGS